MRMLVLGAGLQGSACAFDLLQNPDVAEVRLADINVDHVAPFLARYSGSRLIPTRLDVRDHEAVGALMRQSDAVMSAIPYYFNGPLARLAVECGVHFSDLGGNTAIVQEQKTLQDAAAAKGVSVIPDCGVAPGMVNILAQHGIDALDEVESVRIYVGGLPQQPEPPLNYQIAYSLEGVLDYYTTLSWVLRDGKCTQVKALSELETVTVEGLELEAFHTAGGLSTMGSRYEGKIPTMEYKTLRYPGHAALMEAIRELGLLSLDPVEVKEGTKVAPRDLFVKVVGPRLDKRKPDLCAVRVEATGRKGGAPKRVRFELVDRFDAERGITAMMRCTGYSLSITGQFQAMGFTPKGVHTPDEAMPAERYVEELRKRGLDVKRVES